jgi:hypothetical protein
MSTVSKEYSKGIQDETEKPNLLLLRTEAHLMLSDIISSSRRGRGFFAYCRIVEDPDTSTRSKSAWRRQEPSLEGGCNKVLVSV